MSRPKVGVISLGHYSGFGGWRWGLAMLAIGAALVCLVIAFGAEPANDDLSRLPS